MESPHGLHMQSSLYTILLREACFVAKTSPWARVVNLSDRTSLLFIFPCFFFIIVVISYQQQLQPQNNHNQFVQASAPPAKNCLLRRVRHWLLELIPPRSQLDTSTLQASNTLLTD